MKKYEYENATVYITIPTEKHLANIREATKQYLQKLLTKGIDVCEWNTDDYRSSGKVAGGERSRIEKETRRNR